MRQLFTIMLVIGAITIVVPVHSTLAFDEGSGRLKKFAFVTADDVVSTNSSTFEKIPDMSLEVKTKGPVIISFCAASNNGGSGSMAVTVAVDGDNIPFGMELDGGIQFAVTQAYLPHCFTWVVSDLKWNWHTFDIRWRKSGGGLAYMQSRTLTVDGRFRY